MILRYAELFEIDGVEIYEKLMPQYAVTSKTYYHSTKDCKRTIDLNNPPEHLKNCCYPHEDEPLVFITDIIFITILMCMLVVICEF